MSFFIILQEKYIQKKTIDFFYFSYGRHVAAKPAFHTSLSAHRPLFKIFQLAEKKHSGHLFFSTFHAQKALDAAGTSWCSNLA